MTGVGPLLSLCCQQSLTQSRLAKHTGGLGSGSREVANERERQTEKKIGKGVGEGEEKCGWKKMTGVGPLLSPCYQQSLTQTRQSVTVREWFGLWKQTGCNDEREKEGGGGGGGGGEKKLGGKR